MVLKLYNTLTRKVEVFKPKKGKAVGMYSCGPTIYDYAHIGNLRAYVFSDLLKRYMEYRGFRVDHVMNLTDVDDKTIKGARKKGVSLSRYTEKYKKAFFEDIKKLSIKPASVYPEAKKHVKEMVEIVRILLKKGYAYKSEDGSVYYDISKFKGYGKLSKLKLEGLKAGARVSHDQYEKEDAQDFALWKAWSKEDGDVAWETGVGKGRPGWHIECSAMSMKYLGKHFDVHTGGVDLIFPHHENEIAQSEAVTGKPFVNYWVHNEHLLVDGRKMSKSLGNFYTLRDLLKKGYSGRAVRYLLAATHYRQKLNFTLKGLEGANNSVNRLLDFMDMLGRAKGDGDGKKTDRLIRTAAEKFGKAMDSDLNVSEALAVIFDFVRGINRLSEKGELGKGEAKKVKKIMLDFDKVLGILETGEKVISEEIEKLIREREDARKKKDFAKADRIRKKLGDMGVILEDAPDGVKWKIRKE